MTRWIVVAACLVAGCERRTRDERPSIAATPLPSAETADGARDSSFADSANAVDEPVDSSIGEDDAADPFATVDAAVSPREVTWDAGVSWFRMVIWTRKKPKIEFALPIFATPSPDVNKFLNDEIVARQTKTVKVFEINHADEHGHAEFGFSCHPTLVAPAAVSVLCEYTRVLGMVFVSHSMQNWLIESDKLKAVWFDDVFERSLRGAMLKWLLAEIGRQRAMKPSTYTQKEHGELYDALIQIPEHFAVDRTGFTFVFSPGLVGTMADGVYTVVVPWADARFFAKKGGRFEDLERAAHDPLAHGTPFRRAHPR